MLSNYKRQICQIVGAVYTEAPRNYPHIEMDELLIFCPLCGNNLNLARHLKSGRGYYCQDCNAIFNL